MKKLLPMIVALPVFLLSLLLIRPEATVPVVVAGFDLPEGHVLVASDIVIDQVSKSKLPEDAIGEPAQLIGQTLRVFRGRGDVIKLAHLGGEAIILAPDERAVAIHVTDAAGLAGLIRPGDTVGVSAVMESPGGPFSKTVANGLRVLYISPEFKATQGSTVLDPPSSGTSSFGNNVSAVSGSSRESEGTVVLAVPVDAITIGYDFSSFGTGSASRLVNMTDLLPALDLVDSVRLSLFLEPAAPVPFITSGLFLPDLVVTPAPTPTPTPCPGQSCPRITPTVVPPLP